MAERKPDWLKVKAFGGNNFNDVSALLKDLGLNTVCQAANCPNRGECFNRRTATFLIMGPVCCRNCRFCNIDTGRPEPLNDEEPERVALAAERLKLRHVVVTSVTRDDLPDGGAAHFAETVRRIRRRLPECKIELLTPDFRDVPDALDIVMAAEPDIFNHNLETVPRLYPKVRPGADYNRSLKLLKRAYDKFKAVTKSGLMVGVGEERDELRQVFADLAEHHVSILTIGQYLAPSPKHLPVARFVPPDEFKEYADEAKKAGLKKVFSAPLVRSSYMADVVFSQ
ncbi:MAG: lipoyl synthase [candidate division Zixibacteria bacterium]|nr:lipoyl synthase [candidate division Zixibacteria bacterium]